MRATTAVIIPVLSAGAAPGGGRAYISNFLVFNLRCMHIEEEQLTLYAGGGLLASSELNDEWLETEKKLQTMRRIIVPSSLHDPQPITS